MLNRLLHAKGMRLLFPAAVAVVLIPILGCFSRAIAMERVDSKMIFVDAQQFNVEGRGWTATQDPYDRLPAHAQDRVREPVWNLSHHAAGLHVRFVTDAETIRVRWVLTNPWLYLPNMAATGVSGVDLYVRTE